MHNPNDPDERQPGDPTAEGRVEPDAGERASGGSTGTGPWSGGTPGMDDDPRRTLPLSAEDVAYITGESVPSDPDDPLVGTVLRNKWRVLGRIGAGSFGTVYKVQDIEGEWIEALKILSIDRLRGPEAENAHQRFLREARIMKRLGTMSPHIVALSTYEDDIEAGLIYFLMEHVEGRVLSDVLLQEGPLSIERTIRIGLQTCDALIAAHESEVPVVHRDLKLENIMLTVDHEGEESIKVLDFGIATFATKEADSRLTATGTLGTPGYAAPEQLRAGDIDARTDLFAFGVILYSLVTGRNPWLGHLAYKPSNQTYELMSAADRAEAIPISEWRQSVPQGMVDIISRLLQREPEERFQSARELRDALYALGAGEVSGGRSQITRELRLRQEDTQSRPERRLAAVWFADLVGYSALSSKDEEAALALLDVFHSTARRVIEAGGGRVVQFIGDAAFAEFSSTERAVRTAREFLAEFGKDTVESPYAPQLRIGAHIGDVLMAEDGDLFGDGVNVASRIQNEAEPGQILVSQDVWRQLKQRREFGFVAIGERTLKGIGAPVSLFAVVDAEAGEDIKTTGDLVAPKGDPTTDLSPHLPAEPSRPRMSRGRMVAAAVVAFLALGGGVYAAVTFMGSANGSQAPGASTPAQPEETLAGPIAPGEGAAETDPPPVAPTDQGAVELLGNEEPRGDEATEASTQPAAPDPIPTAAEPEPRPPPEPTPDPFVAVYGERRGDVAPIRTAALGELHPRLQARFDEAEDFWSSAATAAGSGRFQQAAANLAAALPIYQEVVNDSDLMRRVDAANQVLDGLRANARDADLRAQAERSESDADRAVQAGRFQDALDALEQAATLMRSAAAARPLEPEPPEPEIVPDAIATEVLERLKAAMEARDINRVRRVWTSMTEAEVDGYEVMFDRLRELAMRYVISRPARRQGTRVVTVAQLTLSMPSNEQISAAYRFELEEVGGIWVIVASLVQG